MPDTMMNEVGPTYRNRSPEIAKLAAALCKAQAAMEGAKKDSENPHFKNAYADLASVWDAVRKPLTDSGLSVVQFPRTNGNGVEIETTLLHVSGEFMCDVLWVPCSKNDAQGLGSAITYGRRYALMAVAGIAPVDDDGNAAVASHKGGEPFKPKAGMVGGTDFRPAGPRRFQGNGNGGPTSNWVGDAERDGIVDTERPKGALPAATATAKVKDAVKLAERVKKGIAFFKDVPTRDAAQEYWREREDAIGEIEAAMPAEYERLLKAFNDAVERTSARAV